jgi:uncharacterized lipoprotein
MNTQEYTMNSIFRLPRSLLIGAVALALLSSTGCNWMRSKFHSSSDYTKSPESRPLEVPPDLNAPNTSNAMAIPSASGLGSGAVVGQGGFTVDGAPNETWTKVGTLLAGIDGLVINGRAEALNSYDVSYQGHDFMSRVEDVNGKSHVFAISPNGQILRAGPASIVLAALKDKL